MKIPRILICAMLCCVAGLARGDEDWDSLFGEETPSAATPSGESGESDKSAGPDRPASPAAREPGSLTVADPVPTPAPAPARRRIEEIIVTAQKTKQTLQEVPVSVSTVDAQSLREAGIIGPEGIENQVPNLEMDGDPQAPNIGIRGFSTDSFNVGLEPSVGIMLDQLFIGRTEFIPDGLFDMQRVEVLRGPQGTLFGKNTIAGVLIFSSAEPTPEHEGQFLLSAGERGLLRGELGASLPIGDRLSSRLAATHWRSDGDVENSFLQRDELAVEQTAGRVKLRAEATDRLALQLSAQYSTSAHTYPGWQLYRLDPDALAYAQGKHAATEDDPFDQHTAFDLPAYVDRDSDLVHGLAEYDVGDLFGASDVLFTAVLGQAGVVNDILMDYDVSAADLVAVKADFDYRQQSLELRLNGRAPTPWGGGLEFVAGLFGFASDMDTLVNVSIGTDITDFALSPAGAEALGAPDSPSGSNPLGLILNAASLPGPDYNDGVRSHFIQDTQSYAAFGQATWFFAPRWAAIIGLRYGRETKGAYLDVESYGPGITGAIVGAERVQQPLARDEEEISPKLGLRLELSDEIASYFSWTRGFKSGGFNAISFQGSNLEFRPERADAWELGLKSRWLDRSLSLNAALYYTEVTDMQVVNFNGVGFDVFNADGAQLQGLELDLSYLPPWQWLSLDAALGLSEAVYQRYPNGPPTARQADEAGPTDSPVQDLSGRTLPRAPEVSASFRPSISLPLGAWFGRPLGLRIGLDASYRGDQYLELDLDDSSRQSAYWLYGARMILGPQEGSWAVILNGSNLGDAKALNFVADHNLYAHSYFSNQIPPRLISLSYSLQW